MCKEYEIEEVSLYYPEGLILDFDNGYVFVGEPGENRKVIDVSNPLFRNFRKIPDGLYKVSDKGTLVPYKPLPELKGGEMCEVTLVDNYPYGKRKYYVGYFYIYDRDREDLPYDLVFCDYKGQPPYKVFAIDHIESITILKPISQ